MYSRRFAKPWRSRSTSGKQRGGAVCDTAATRNVGKHPTGLRVHQKRDPKKPCVYVGMSGLPPEHRFENHKHGYKAAWVVKKYGMRLLPELFEHLNPMPYEAALQMELELAEDLRNEGYTVTGGH